MRKTLLAVAAVGLSASLSAQAGAKVMPSSPALIEKGKTAYTTNCVTCHGDKGDGNGPAGAVMNPKPRNFAADKFKKGDKPEQVFATLTKGLEGTSMAGYSYLSDEDRWGLTYYVLSLRKGGK